MADGDKILLDVPSRRPALEFDDTARVLAEFVRDSDPQFAIGIFGGWGSGKTTLMRAIAGKLPADRCVIVDFSAWRYEKEQHLIVPLLDTVRDSLMAWARGHPGERRLARQTAGKIGRAARAILAGFSVQVGMEGAIKASYEANKSISDYRAGSEAARVPQSFYHAAFNALKSAFEPFAGGSTGRRIVVFVDDLDRCLPEGALEVLESMKLFFDLPGFVFVVGLDQDVVEQVIDHKYPRREGAQPENAAQAGASTITGAAYIKKIFQLPYTLTPVSTAQLPELLQSIYDEAGLSAEQKAKIREQVQPHLEHVTERAVNPREVKRFINAYTLTTRIRDELDPRPLLALQTIAFRADWRPARLALNLYRDVFLDALRRQLRLGQPTALEDLGPELLAVPESFLSYVATQPGSALLDAEPIDRYLYAGEAVRSTRGPQILDAIKAFADVRRDLRGLRTSVGDRAERGGAVLKALSRLEGLTESIARGPTAEFVQSDLRSARECLARYTEDERTAEQYAELREDADRLMQQNIRRLNDLYFASDIGPTAA